jgi:hypothetical protein
VDAGGRYTIECFPCLLVDLGEYEPRKLEIACVPLDFRVLNCLHDQSSIDVRGVREGVVNAVGDRSFSEIWVHQEELGELIAP